MKLQFELNTVPGTILKRSDVEGLTGLPFLRHLFLATDGVMMATIRSISGLDTSTLQNWVKRGWMTNSKNRKYDLEQVAHILLINMLRSCMQLEKAAFIIGYINGDIADPSDDIISDSILYDTICRILEAMEKEKEVSLDSVHKIIAKITADYREPIPGAKRRLTGALEIIVITYVAANIKEYADGLFAKLGSICD